MSINTPGSQGPDLKKSRVMLARLTVNSWSGKRFDRQASDEVAQNHAHNGIASTDIGRFNKRLMLRTAEHFNQLLSLEGRAREAFHDATLAYDGDGVRLMPVRSYLDYVAEYQTIKAKFSAQVQLFLDHYDGYKADARMALNGLFQDADYPTIAELKNRFRMTLDVWPFPEAEHFCVDELTPEATAAIRSQIEESRIAAIAQAKDEMRSRLLEVVQHMATRLANVADGGRLHDSVVDSVMDTLNQLPKLNFLSDPQITEAITYARSQLSQYTTGSLRANRALCAPAAAAAQRVVLRLDRGFGLDVSAFAQDPEAGDGPPDAVASSTAGMLALFA